MKPALRTGPAPLGARLDAHRRRARSTSVDRGVYDTLKRRRETEQSPPDLLAAFTALDALRGHSLDLDQVRAAAIEVAVAAMAIVCRLPPRDLSLER